MKRDGFCRAISVTVLAATVSIPAVVLGAGVGNLTYTAAELEKPISNFGGAGAGKFPSGPTGSNTVLMLRDVFVVMGSNDSGKPPGAFHMFDIKNPRAPKLLSSLVGTPDVANLRELHAMPVAMVNGRDILVFPNLTGISFFDFTDAMAPKLISTLALPGVNGGDYDNAAWMLSWAYPYVYVGATGNGVFIVDATDPTKPTMLKQINTGSMGNFRIGPTYAAGNYLVAIGMDQTPTKVAIVDVGDPKAPFLLVNGSTPASLYSAVVVGDRIYGPGTNGDYAFLKWTPTAVTTVSTGKSGTDRGGYCGFQSGFAICGQSSEGYKKWDVRSDTAPTLVGHGTDPAGVGGDFDFATILGNLVYLGNDHGTGAALIPHTMAPDTTAPQVAKIFPNDGDTRQALTTRVTVFLSEDVDIASISTSTLFLRKAGGTALDGTFSKSSFNAISFGPKLPLDANSTYEVVVPSGGLKDLVGNTIATTTVARFSTGTALAPGTGGAGGGTVGSTGGAAGGTSGGGTTGSTGGATTAGTGGVVGSGSGGVTGSGGTTILGTGGAASGGAVGSGGTAVSSTGGTNASTGGQAPMAGGGGGGCGCNVPGGGASAGGLSLLAIALMLGRRSRTRHKAVARQ